MRKAVSIVVECTGTSSAQDLVITLKREDFPTLGTPTIPICKLFEGRPRRIFFSATAACAAFRDREPIPRDAGGGASETHFFRGHRFRFTRGGKVGSATDETAKGRARKHALHSLPGQAARAHFEFTPSLLAPFRALRVSPNRRHRAMLARTTLRTLAPSVRAISTTARIEMEIKTITVFGAGLMGAGIVQVAAQNGLKVGQSTCYHPRSVAESSCRRPKKL